MNLVDRIKRCGKCRMPDYVGTLFTQRTAPIVLECGKCMRQRLEDEIAMWRQQCAELKTELLETKAQLGFLEAQAVGR